MSSYPLIITANTQLSSPNTSETNNDDDRSIYHLHLPFGSTIESNASVELSKITIKEGKKILTI